jgi:hypothetical protein
MVSTTFSQLSLPHLIGPLAVTVIKAPAEKLVVSLWSGPHTSWSAASKSMPPGWPPPNTGRDEFGFSAVT